MCVSVCLGFGGVLRAAIRGQQEAHHGGRKENPSSGWRRGSGVGGVVDEILGHSRGGERGTLLEEPLHIPAAPMALYPVGRRADA